MVPMHPVQGRGDVRRDRGKRRDHECPAHTPARHPEGAGKPGQQGSKDQCLDPIRPSANGHPQSHDPSAGMKKVQNRRGGGEELANPNEPGQRWPQRANNGDDTSHDADPPDMVIRLFKKDPERHRGIRPRGRNENEHPPGTPSEPKGNPQRTETDGIDGKESPAAMGNEAPSPRKEEIIGNRQIDQRNIPR